MKKKRHSAPAPMKKGIARQHLIDIYSSIDNQNLKIGHILHLFLENNKSVAATIQAVSPLLPFGTLTPNKLKPLINKLECFKHLGRENEKDEFVEFCARPFMMSSMCDLPASPTPMDVSPTPQPELDEGNSFEGSASTICAMEVLQTNHPSTQDPLPGPSNVNLFRLFRNEVTPRKVKLKRRLQFVSTLRSAEKKKFHTRVTVLNDKIDLQKVYQIKYLNQNIRRMKQSMKKKDAIITLLKKEVREMEQGPGRSSEYYLKQLQRNHERLKISYKLKRKAREVETVSKDKFLKLQTYLSEKDELIRQYENEICELKEKLAEIEKEKTKQIETRKDRKTYSTDTRMLVYDAIVNQVPTQNIPIMMDSHSKRMGETLLSVPHRSSVEQMARELNSIADLKTAELAMRTKDLTLGFDATTQEGVHINSVHLTTKNDCEGCCH
ncbi:hypothetical protein SNE40_013538 [Patella caerulea]|uniref:Uncharacterized protein n=1 Tax=Patella caerulea TaxID=87958 RepID=A0AAN8JGC5_PATCE